MASFVFSSVVFAQAPAGDSAAGQFVTAGDVGLSEIQQTSGLGNQGFVTIIAKIIRIILSLLGVMCIILVIYAGFVWMTAGGSEEAVEKAKKMLVNGGIGLLIILSAYAITEFTMRSLIGATGANLKTGAEVGTAGGFSGDLGTSSGSSGVSGGLVMKSIEPRGTNTYANLQVVAIASGALDSSTVAKNFVVKDAAGAVIPGEVKAEGDSIVFSPSATCPAPHTTLKCFTAGLTYTVTVTGGKDGVIGAVSKKPLVCSATSCTMTFIAGDKVDTKPPTMSNIKPAKESKIAVDAIIPIEALMRDENALLFGRVTVDNVILETVQAPQFKGGLAQELLLQSKKFNTQNNKLNTVHTITLTARDVAGNQTSETFTVTVVPQYCFNNVKDGDEIAIDCSAPKGACGLCTNGACTANNECANGSTCAGASAGKVCGSSPVIQSVTPYDGAPGNIISISGQGFGTAAGTVIFLGDPKNSKDDVTAQLACDDASSWQNTRVTVAIPQGAVSGPLLVRTTAGSSDITDDADGTFLSQFIINATERPGLCSITPTTGLSGKAEVIVTGNNAFLSQQVDRKLFFNGYVATKVDWNQVAPNLVKATVPAMPSGYAEVHAVIKGMNSNPLEFIVTDTLSAAASAATASGLTSSGTGGGTSGGTGGGTSGGTVSGSSANAVLSISTVKPVKGGAGQFVTINGVGFGNTPNKVLFEKINADGTLSGLQVNADTTLPAQCAQTFWDNTQIISKIPDIGIGDYAVLVYPSGVSKPITYKKFTVTGDKAGPQICAIQPSNGPADGSLTVTFYGENLGTVAGRGMFSPQIFGDAPKLSGQWTPSAAGVVVPEKATTGNVQLQTRKTPSTTLATDECSKNPSVCSNPLNFIVKDCRATQNSCGTGVLCCTDGSCQKDCTAASKKLQAAFAWCFSTGDSCDATVPPTIKEECNKTGDVSKNIPSPTPSSAWTGDGNACTNARVIVRFTESVDPQTITTTNGTNSSLYMEKCIGEAGDVCGKTDPALVTLSDIKVVASESSKTYALFATPKQLAPDSTYRVSLTSDINGSDSGLPLVSPKTNLSKCTPAGKAVYCFTFKTQKTTEPCTVDAVGITPSSHTAEQLGVIRSGGAADSTPVQWIANPFPQDKCQVLDASMFVWKWSPSKSGDVGLEYTHAMQADADASWYFAKQPTPAGKPITLAVTEVESKKSAQATLTINPGAPIIYESCSTGGGRSPTPSVQWGAAPVCPDAVVAVEFNQEVAGLDFKLYPCEGTKAGKECEQVSSAPSAATLEIQKPIITEARYPYYLLPNESLKTNTWYMAEIGAATKGVGTYGKPINKKTGCRAGVAYCFTFKTALDKSNCEIKKVEIDPNTYVAKDVGLQKMTTYNKEGVATEADQLWTAKPFGVDSCVIIKNTGSWSWYIDPDHKLFAAIDPDNKLNDGSPAQTVAAYQETKATDPLRLSAVSQNVAGTGYISIAFPQPTVESYEPSACNTGVCKNAQLSISFSTPMALQTLANAFTMAECPSAVVDSTGGCVISESAYKTLPTVKLKAEFAAGSSKKIILTAPSGTIKPNTTYRLFMTGTPRSTAGKAFVGVNYPSEKPFAFSWSFSVGAADCPIGSIAVEPVAPFAQAQGQTQLFNAQPRSEPSSCYPQGQSLSASSYVWQWESGDSTVAEQSVPTTVSSSTFKMVGTGAVVDGFQTAKISAAAVSKTGSAEWKLQCNAVASSCPNGTSVGADKCCYVPPKVNEVYPKNGAQSVCRNTLIKAAVRDLLAPATVNNKTVRIGVSASNGGCVTGAILEGGYCYGSIPFDAQLINESASSTKRTGTIFINLNAMLPAQTAVRVQVLPTPESTPAVDSSVTTALGVPIIGAQWEFKTADTPCALSGVETSPKNISFYKLGQTQPILAYGLSNVNGALVPLSGIPQQYDWTWSWHSTKKAVATFQSASKSEMTTSMTGGVNGTSAISGVATISADKYFTPSTTGKTVVGTTMVSAMLCDAPWESSPPSVISDALSSQNISFWYCKKNGSTILPHLTPIKDNIADLSASDQYTVLSAFHLADTVNGGAIGMRIEKNLKHYSPEEWFYQKEFKGTPQKVTVGDMPAVRVGNTVYISYGNKIANGDQYTNMLVISLSSGAPPALAAIFDQIIQQITFSTNLTDVGLCGVGKQTTDVACTSDLECPTDLKTFLQNKQAQAEAEVVASAAAKKVTSTDKNVLSCTNGLCVQNGNRITPDISCDTREECIKKIPEANAKFSCESSRCFYDGSFTGTECNDVADCVIPFTQQIPKTDTRTCDEYRCVIEGKKYFDLECWNETICYDYDITQLPAPPPAPPPPSLDGPAYCKFDRSKFLRDTERVLHVATFVRSLDKAKAFAGKYPIVAQGTFVPGLVSSKWSGWNSFMQQLGIGLSVDPLNNYSSCGEGYDPQTCWNATTKLYRCAAQSQVYHYKTVASGAGYELGVTFEQPSNMTAEWRGDIQTVLSGAVKKINTAMCSGTPYTPTAVCGDGAVAATEECDPPGLSATIKSTDFAVYPYGAYTATCGASCLWTDKKPVDQCGDGVVQKPPELCDEGSKYNGLYNHCAKDCGVASNKSFGDLGACGNGKIEKNEVCDVASPFGKFYKFAVHPTEGPWFVQCVKGAAPKDLKQAFVNTAKPNAPLAFYENVPAKLGEASWQKESKLVQDFCSGSLNAYGYCAKRHEISCASNSDCIDGDVCDFKVIGSFYALVQKDSCNWDCKGTGPYCGDKFVSTDFGEQCDGDQTATENGVACKKACTAACAWASVATNGQPVCTPIQTAVSGPPAPPPGCGDGVVTAATGEECDAGLDCTPLTNDKPCKVGGLNGVACTPTYGTNSCQYCSTACKKAFISGGACGDGVRNGAEVCDGKDLSGFCVPTTFQYSTYACKKDCSGVQVATQMVKDQIVVALSPTDYKWWAAKVISPETAGDKLSVEFLNNNTSATVPLWDVALRGSEVPKKDGIEPFPVGTAILGKWQNKDQWYVGAITAASGGKYSIAYDDGAKEVDVPLERVAYFPGRCVKCGDSSLAFSTFKGVTPSYTAATTAKDATFSFTDPTLGYYPLRSPVRVNHFIGDELSSKAIGDFTSVVATSNVVSSRMIPLWVDNGPAQKIGMACYALASKYRITLDPHYVNKTGNFKPWGGAFSYGSPVVDYGSISIPLPQNVTPKTYDIQPYGEEGDYRIVLKAPQSQSLWGAYINWTITAKKEGDSVFSGDPSGYVLDGSYKPTKDCFGSGYKSKADNSIILGEGGDTTTLVWRDGCIASSPRVQLEYMYPTVQSSQLHGQGRFVTTLRRGFPNSNAFYAAVYQPKVVISGGAKNKGVTLSIYFYSSGSWKLIKVLTPETSGFVSGQGFINWYPFFFMPDQTETGGSLLGTGYQPAQALYHGEFDPSETPKKLLP